METNQQGQDRKPPEQPGKHDSKPERVAKKIDPPGTEVSYEDLIDPGRMTPGAPPVDDRS